jgi:hypothetical protein
MPVKYTAVLVSTFLAITFPVASAQERPEAPCPASDHSLHRAGNPQTVAWYARPSDTGHDIGYYVGGGCGCRGESRHPDEGVWGWDYRGCLIPRRIVLSWCHCGPYQGGIGYYRTVPKPNFASPSTP